MTRPLVTFASDFGTREHYVGAVKGVILATCPDAVIVDVSHEIPSHDLLAGAFTLAGYYDCFPPGTIHLVVVDPGVGSDRRSIAAAGARYRFVGPDNGVFSLAFGREGTLQVVSIEAEHYFRRPVAPTFHARDIFAPTVGWLARGIEVEKFGPTVTDYRTLAVPRARQGGEGVVEGFVLHIDKFGNLITNLTPAAAAELGLDPSACLIEVGGQTVRRQVRCYAEGNENEACFLVGSGGYYEVAVPRQSAARLLNTRRGAKVALARA